MGEGSKRIVAEHVLFVEAILRQKEGPSPDEAMSIRTRLKVPIFENTLSLRSPEY